MRPPNTKTGERDKPWSLNISHPAIKIRSSGLTCKFSGLWDQNKVME